MSKMLFKFNYVGPSKELSDRTILGLKVREFHNRIFKSVRSQSDWNIEIPDNLLFDLAGIRLILKSLEATQYNSVRIFLQPSKSIFRDFYSLSYNQEFLSEKPIDLGITCTKNRSSENPVPLIIKLPYLNSNILFPKSLHQDESNEVASALLFPYKNSFDLLFVNQIATLSKLQSDIRGFPYRCWRVLYKYKKNIAFNTNLSLAYKKIWPRAQIHPTAVIEGSTIGENSVIGAHCVVRYSHIGNNVKLFDGAKVEFSTVGDRSWLMHDLVLYRSYTESDVFLIHGPYQFSGFQEASAAFATIMMDYRPDTKNITVQTPNGKLSYAGRFLGALLKPKSKSLGGVLLAPGSIINEGSFVGAPKESIQKICAADY